MRERVPEDAYTATQLIGDVWAFVHPYRFRFFIASFARLIGDVAWLYPSFALAALVNELSKGAELDQRALVFVFIFWGIAIVVRAYSQYLTRTIGFRIGEKVVVDVTKKAMRHLTTLDMAWHERENSGNKVKRIQNASHGMDRLIRMWFNMLIEIGVNFIGIFVILATIESITLAPLALFVVTYFTLSYTLGRRAALASLEVDKEGEVVSGILYETAANIRTVKVLSFSEAILERLSGVLDVLYHKVARRIDLYQIRGFVLMLWAQSFHIGILAFIAYGVWVGHYEVGFIILFHRFFGQLWDSVSELSEFSQEFMSSKLSIARLRAMLDTEPAVHASKQTEVLSPTWQTIQFKNVSFTYQDVPVLKNVSFSVHRGEKIGVVGLSGAGKSTLFKLLMKEREVYEGEILVDGTPLHKIGAEGYFSRVAAVLQDTEVFNMSLKDNITIAGSGDHERAFQDALRIAHVSDFVERLPLGIETLIGERGVKLSGGERQRLGIARALYKKPELLLMDEATSHLDTESEEKIQDSLRKVFEQVTAVVIAHRLSTIKAMDRILVIENGEVVECGTFDDLRAKKGRFNELWEKQRI